MPTSARYLKRLCPQYKACHAARVCNGISRSRHKLNVAVDADDFNNMAGNLIENAEKWAANVIRVAAHPRGGGMELVIEDDGPGIAEEDIERVTKRGERADTSVAGSGLGLAIVSDLVELYKGTLELSRSPLGGLKAVLRL